MSATQHWRIDETGFPTEGSTREKLEFVVKYAAIAPPERSWQPWELRVSNRCVELFANRAPDSGRLDPEGRDTLISCGSALEFLKVALKHFGCLGRIEQFPSLDQPTLVARIHVGQRGNQEGDDAHFAAINSFLNLSKLAEGRKSSDLFFDEIQAEAGVGAGWLEFAQSEMTRQKLRSLADTAITVRVGESDPPSGGLLETVVRHAGRRLGGSAISGSYLTFARWTRPLLNLKLSVRTTVEEGPREPNPTRRFPGRLAVLKTKTDDRRGWLAAGQTLARAVLCARKRAIPCVLFTGALKDPSLRTELRTSIGHKGFAQVILEFPTERVESDSQSPFEMFSRTSTAQPRS